jgi:hypothetical protein
MPMLFVSTITNSSNTSSNTTHVLGSIDEFGIRAQIYFGEPHRKATSELQGRRNLRRMRHGVCRSKE